MQTIAVGLHDVAAPEGEVLDDVAGFRNRLLLLFGQAAFVLRAAVLTSSLTESGVAERVAPNILSIAHWERLGDGELYAPLSLLDWATLLKRTFAVDVRVCVRCGGPLLVRAVVTDPAAIAARLDALRRARDPPAAA